MKVNPGHGEIQPQATVKFTSGDGEIEPQETDEDHVFGRCGGWYSDACAAAPACTYPSDILSHQRVHNLLATPLDVVDSCIRVPDGPGLGVELDEDALQRYTVT